MSYKQRIIILRSNPVAPDPRVEKEARCLSRSGYLVNVLCWDREGAFRESEVCETEFDIQRIRILANYGTGLNNLPALIRWQFALVFQLYRRRRTFDVIHACDFDTVLPAVLMKVFLKKKVIYDIFDFYADHLRKTPKWIKKIIRRLDLGVVNFVDGVIIVDENRKQQIEGSHPRHLACIYNTPADRFRMIKIENEAESALSITYVGLLQWERGLAHLIKAVKENADFHLDIAGFGGDQTAIANASENHPNINYYGRIQYNQALALSARADLIWALYDPSVPNHRFASPNKLFEAMMLGKPVIVAKGTNIDTLVAEKDCGYIVDYQDYDQILTVLNICASNPDQCRLKGGNGRKAYDQNYSWSIMEIRLLDLYKKVVE